MDRRDRLALWVISVILSMELAGFVLLAYFSTFSSFLTHFAKTLGLLSPVFMWSYIIFIIVIIAARGQELTRASWKDYISETFHFFLLSFLAASAALAVSALFGTVLSFLLRKLTSSLYYIKAAQLLRDWVRYSFY